MGEFHEAYRQKVQRLRFLPLCSTHVERNLVVPHEMVDITGLGDECVWCGTDDVHAPAVWLVDLGVSGG